MTTKNVPQSVTLTGTESAQVATLLLMGMEAIRVVSLEMMHDGEIASAIGGAKLVHQIQKVLNAIGARQNGEEGSFDLPDGEVLTASEFAQRMDEDDEEGRAAVASQRGLVLSAPKIIQ